MLESNKIHNIYKLHSSKLARQPDETYYGYAILFYLVKRQTNNTLTTKTRMQESDNWNNIYILQFRNTITISDYLYLFYLCSTKNVRSE